MLIPSFGTGKLWIDIIIFLIVALVIIVVVKYLMKRKESFNEDEPIDMTLYCNDLDKDYENTKRYCESMMYSQGYKDCMAQLDHVYKMGKEQCGVPSKIDCNLMLKSAYDQMKIECQNDPQCLALLDERKNRDEGMVCSTGKVMNMSDYGADC